jgi:hypothetical protein
VSSVWSILGTNAQEVEAAAGEKLGSMATRTSRRVELAPLAR